jgi:HD superfamily phosphohydrolase
MAKAAARPQRIRDPLHNLIEFDTSQFERSMWRIIQTRPFQRLRRIRQLGFSEFVYPGATHTRFAHSIGVFHTARRLMEIVRSKLGAEVGEHQVRVALAAALVHDLGHGMFSHSFEEIGKALGLRMARHELVSDMLIRDSEVTGALNGELGGGFADDVADMIKRGQPGSLYDAVVSSQFDADRLDYMQRDRLLTGVQNSGIDFAWLMANLEIGEIPDGVDDKASDTVETFVLGPKAYHAAEAYVLALFQLYPTVYLHKTTRGAEKLFSALMLRLVPLVQDGDIGGTGLPANHPIIRFAGEADKIEHAQALDDTVFWGALPLLAEAGDPAVVVYARRLLERRLLKTVDIRRKLLSAIRSGAGEDGRRQLERLTVSIEERLKAWNDEQPGAAKRVLLDRSSRNPYKRFQESKTPLNQIHIRADDGRIVDMAEYSPVVAALETFHVFRAYVDAGDSDARKAIDQIVAEELKRDGDLYAQA